MYVIRLTDVQCCEERMGGRWESFPRTPVRFALRERWRAWDGAGGEGGDDGRGVKVTRCKEIRFGARGGVKATRCKDIRFGARGGIDS